MSYSIKSKLSALRHKRYITDDEYKQLCKALDNQKGERSPEQDIIEHARRLGIKIGE